MTATELDAVLDLLPTPVSEATHLGGPGRPWLVRYGATRAVLRRNDPGRFRDFGQSEDVELASVVCLHNVLRDLAQLGFVAPAPIADLTDQSVAVVDGAIWELLTHVPGRPMGWTDDEMRAAGAHLARFHQTSLRLPPRSQRPGAQPLSGWRPAHPAARQVRAVFERELNDIQHDSAPRGVIHGDATQSNAVIDDRGEYRLVDFAIAYPCEGTAVESVIATVSAAIEDHSYSFLNLWRTNLRLKLVVNELAGHASERTYRRRIRDALLQSNLIGTRGLIYASPRLRR